MSTPPVATAAAVHRLQLVVSSHQRLTGRPLIDSREPDLWAACWAAPRVIVAHDTQADPVFFYGNELALRCFELDFAAFTRLPSRFSAEPLLRAERDALLARVQAQGFIDDYAGVRIAAIGPAISNRASRGLECAGRARRPTRPGRHVRALAAAPGGSVLTRA